MQNVKELSIKEMQKVNGGDTASCISNVAVGVLGGWKGVVGGAATGCVSWGVKKDWRTPTFKDPHYRN